MTETPAKREIDGEGLVGKLRNRVADERAAGAYADDLSGVELEVLPAEREPQGGLAARFDLGAESARIRFRPELGFSSKPVVGAPITLVKRFLLRLLFFVFDDLARQADAAVSRLEAALSAEAAARESVERDLRDLAKRQEGLEARLAQLEESGRSPTG